MPQQPFNIVHLSDLHLTPTENKARTELDVFAPLKGMNRAFRTITESENVQKAHLVLITGDVTDRGDIATWQVFWHIINRAGLSKKVCIVPGNHDVCCLAARLPGKRRLYRKQDLIKAITGLKMGNQSVRYPWSTNPDPRVVIFGLNSNNLGNLNITTNAMGQLGYFQLKSLANMLYKHRHIPVKIICLHHSPNIPSSKTARKRGQRAFSRLERIGHQIPQEHRHALILLGVTHRVRLIVHGHLHQAEDRKISGIRIIGAPASTEPIINSGNQKEYHYFTYKILGNGGQVRCLKSSITCDNNPQTK